MINSPIAEELVAEARRERKETDRIIETLKASGRMEEALRSMWPTLGMWIRERVKRLIKRKKDPLLDIGLRNAVARFDLRTWDAEIGAEIEAIRDRYRSERKKNDE